MNHLETKEFILYALNSAVDAAVEKAVASACDDQKAKHLNDMKSLRRAIEIITALPEADLLCAPLLDWDRQ